MKSINKFYVILSYETLIIGAIFKLQELLLILE